MSLQQLSYGAYSPSFIHISAFASILPYKTKNKYQFLQKSEDWLQKVMQNRAYSKEQCVHIKSSSLKRLLASVQDKSFHGMAISFPNGSNGHMNQINILH